MPRDLAIYMQPPGGLMEQFGAGLARGIVPEGYSDQHDAHGALSAQFILRRDAGVQWPDNLPGTPLWAVVDGLVSFQGRVAETPTRRGGDEDSIQVVCEGWQNHLSDDAIQRTYVQTDVNQWKDARGYSGVALGTTYIRDAQITAGSGPPTVGWANGTYGAGNLAAIVLDAGPGNTFARIVYAYGTGGTNLASNFNLGTWFTDDATLAIGSVIAADRSVAAATGGGATIDFSPTTPRRYVVIYLERIAASAAVTSNFQIQVTSAQAFTKTTYVTGGASNLKASDVIKDVLPFAPLISQDTTRVSSTSFNIPHLVGARDSVRAYIDAVNAYHLWQWYLDLGTGAGDKPRMNYRAIPTMPVLEAPVGNGVEFADASRNAIAELYNAVTVEYTDATGVASAVSRSASDGAVPAVWMPSRVAVANPTFESDTVGLAPAGWTATGLGSLLTVASGDASAKAMQVTSSAGGQVNPTPSVAPVGVAGVRYRVSWRIQRLAGWTTGNLAPVVLCTTSTGIPVQTFAAATIAPASLTVGQWTTVSVDLTVPAGGTTMNLNLGATLVYNASTALYLVDNVTILESKPTLLDRQGFIRRRVLASGVKLTSAAAQQIGDAFLALHYAVPLRGTLSVKGSAIREVTTGRAVKPSEIARHMGDAIMVSGGEQDPTTYALGRVGIISGVTYSHDDDSATITLQNSLDFIDALLARLALYQG